MTDTLTPSSLRNMETTINREEIKAAAKRVSDAANLQTRVNKVLESLAPSITSVTLKVYEDAADRVAEFSFRCPSLDFSFKLDAYYVKSIADNFIEDGADAVFSRTVEFEEGLLRKLVTKGNLMGIMYDVRTLMPGDTPGTRKVQIGKHFGCGRSFCMMLAAVCFKHVHGNK